MPDGLEKAVQASFAAGAYPGYEDIPQNGCEDIVNGVLRDDGALERRGGIVYHSNADLDAAGGSYLNVLYDTYLSESRATLMAKANGTLGVLAANDASPLLYGSAGSFTFAQPPRPIEVGGVILVPSRHSSAGYSHQAVAWGGSKVGPASTYNAGTVALTENSKTVTGTGTAFDVGGVSAGQIIYRTGTSLVTGLTHERIGVIASVDSPTQLTLAEPWPYTTQSGSYTIATIAIVGIEHASSGPEWTYLATAMGKMFVGQGNTLWQSKAETGTSYNLPQPLNMNRDEYHMLPEGAWIVGLEATGDRLLVFTTAGVWAVSNIAFNMVDDFGNPQQELAQVNRHVLLWGEAGIASWRNGLIVPGRDDLYLIDGTGDAVAITGGARVRYREHADAGYMVGRAAVYRGHYLLPVFDGADGVEIMAWRLDAPGYPFVRWTGNASTTRALSVRPATTSEAPKLLGATALRVSDLSACFNATEDGDDPNGHDLQVTTRSLMTDETQDHTLRKVRVRYELDDAASDDPVLTAEWSRGRPGSSFTSLTGSAAEGEGSYTWTLAKKAQQTRIRVTSGNAASRCILRAVELHMRRHGGM